MIRDPQLVLMGCLLLVASGLFFLSGGGADVGIPLLPAAVGLLAAPSRSR